MPNDLSNAIVLYLGFGSAPSPRADRAALVREFGLARAAELEAEIESLLKELGEIRVDWTTHSLASAGDAARDALRARRPYLSDEALGALAWKFTFDWR